MLFDAEPLNISKINFVTNYNPRHKKIHSFLGNLPYYELMYFYQGDLRLEFGDKSFFVKTGDVVYLPKGLDNQNYKIISKHRFGVYNVYFDTADPLPNHAVHIPCQSKRLEATYETMRRIWVVKSPGYYLKTMQLFYEVLQYVAKQQTSYAKLKNDNFFLLIEEYIAQHFCDKNFDFEQLAKCTNFSYSYFKKVFISKYGLPPVKYITLLKINYACELLIIDKYKISEVAELCGYENIYYFSNVFKKLKGVSPKNYIASLNKNIAFQ